MMEPPLNLSIARLLYTKIPFVVEKYQRDYAWEEDHVDDFITDILRLYQSYDRQPGSPGMRHFFGGIVSVITQLCQLATHKSVLSDV